jgi:hypothetical protein
MCFQCPGGPGDSRIVDYRGSSPHDDSDQENEHDPAAPSETRESWTGVTARGTIPVGLVPFRHVLRPYSGRINHVLKSMDFNTWLSTHG